MSIMMQQAEPFTRSVPTTDPAGWVEAHGDALYRYALAQARDTHVAEDLVQEALLAALQARHQFAGRCSERTWLIGILKHKIADHFRRAARRRPVETTGALPFEQEGLFNAAGSWKGHWHPERGPAAWDAEPAALLEQAEFWGVLQACLNELPPRLARAFWLREVEDQGTEAICKELDITATNLWVMLHRARMQLRRSLEKQWFGADVP